MGLSIHKCTDKRQRHCSQCDSKWCFLNTECRIRASSVEAQAGIWAISHVAYASFPLHHSPFPFGLISLFPFAFFWKPKQNNPASYKANIIKSQPQEDKPRSLCGKHSLNNAFVAACTHLSDEQGTGALASGPQSICLHGWESSFGLATLVGWLGVYVPRKSVMMERYSECNKGWAAAASYSLHQWSQLSGMGQSVEKLPVYTAGSRLQRFLLTEKTDIAESQGLWYNIYAQHLRVP